MWYILYLDLQYYKLDWAVYVWYRDPNMGVNARCVTRFPSLHFRYAHK
jgi:hypothetical protein